MDVERFADFLRTSELPPGLFAPDVFCDLNVPSWRFQLLGAESLAGWTKDEAPHGSAVTVGRVRRAGATTAVETEMEADGSYSRNLWLLTTGDDGLVEELVLYCTGLWDEETRQRQAREAPMIRP